MKKSVLIAKDLHKTFYTPEPLPILKGISIEVEEGETIAIMGKSGEGKSTLLHVLGTLEAPTQGKIQIKGKDVDHVRTAALRNEHIGFIFQNFNLLEDYSVLENVLMPAKIGRRSTKRADPSYQKGLELIERVGLSSRLHFPIKLLSGGEKQRAAIARSLCNDPDLILADEPSGNLDRATSAHIHSLLIESAKQFSKSLIVVTHDQELAALCDRILILKDGHLH
ncbi:MAG TPA: ABC transporter ATP-binding protein [Rhabdochlamydiaceae bacterium]|nr:ABC transporter ATP-binding protein [Rhabdochlamydiaceae bacterium]